MESKRRCVDEAIQKKTSDAEHWQWIQDQAIAFTRNRAATLIQRAWLHAKYRPGGSGMIDVVTKCYERERERELLRRIDFIYFLNVYNMQILHHSLISSQRAARIS